GDCVIGKMQHVPATRDLRNESVILRVGDEGVVDKVLVTSDNKTTVVTVKLRVMRVPQEGDKFAPRNAQKGTCGLVMSDIDMPVNEDGISPDFIVNPHSMPSRMTLEYPMEIFASKHGAMRGVHVNGTAFKPFPMEEYRQTMKDYNKHEFGYEKMRSGTSGKPLQSLIYSGTVFFQALKHHVKDKVQVRSTGPVKPMTRQPPKGRGNRGGLRFGKLNCRCGA
ncbi:MAG: DNA-directed RNA polymerase subunit B, partial [Gemmatimonadales bacterium]